LLVGCGGNGNTTSQSTYNNGSGDQPYKPITHLSHRSLVSNLYTGQLEVMETTKDKLTAYTFTVGRQPTYMQSSPDGWLTFINNSGSNTISSFDNYQETVKATIELSGWTESFVTSQNNKLGYAAVYNYSNGTYRTPGAILPFNPTDGSLNTQIPFPNVRYLAMDSAEKHLLAFTDVDDNAHWVDLTTIDPLTLVQTVSVLPLPAGTLSRPVAAFFSSDSTKAYILSCGVECGGTSAASVTEIDVTIPTAATVVRQWTAPTLGARRGLIDLTANKLYVAGSVTTSTSNDCPYTGAAPACTGVNNVQDGFFTVIDLTTGIAGTPIRIGNGVKRWIRNINGNFWVSSTNCGVQSCISLVNPTAGTAKVLTTAKGDGTGISLSANSGKVYTIEGGELYIYDQKGNTIKSEFDTDVKGQASDVLYIN